MEDATRSVIPDVEYDLATISLKGKRFDEAAEKFTKIIMRDQTSEAWCGLGLSKLGLILEKTTVEEIFYCFTKAKEVGVDNTSELEIIAMHATLDVCASLFKLYVNAVLMSRKANNQKTMAMVSTIMNAGLTLESRGKNRVMSSIAFAGLTALSYDNYLKAGSTIGEMTSLYNRVAAKIEELKILIRSYMVVDLDKLNEFNSAMLDYEKQVVNSLQTTQQRASDERKYNAGIEAEYQKRDREEKIELIKDKAHPFHSYKANALDLYKRRKYKEALMKTNGALEFFEYDAELKDIKAKMLQRYVKHDLLVLVPVCFVAAISIGLALHVDSNTIQYVFLLTAFFIIGVVLYRQVQRSGVTDNSSSK